MLSKVLITEIEAWKQVAIDHLERDPKKHRICEITYRASSNKTSNMALAPMRLIAYRDGLYMKGRLEKALASPDGYFDPTLAVHRIVSLKTTERTFARPKNSKRKTGRTFGFMPGEPFPVKVSSSSSSLLCFRAYLE